MALVCQGRGYNSEKKSLEQPITKFTLAILVGRSNFCLDGQNVAGKKVQLKDFLTETSCSSTSQRCLERMNKVTISLGGKGRGRTIKKKKKFQSAFQRRRPDSFSPPLTILVGGTPRKKKE